VAAVTLQEIRFTIVLAIIAAAYTAVGQAGATGYIAALPYDKPAKVTVELPATVHRDLVAYAEILGRRRAANPRSCQAHCTHADAVQCNSSCFCQGAACASSPQGGRRIA
jgi:hypothetical protein